MATPYLQMFVDDVPSTQDLARARLGELPQVVIAAAQSRGRGRSRATWVNADRALAVSVAWKDDGDVGRPLSLIAGVAATRVLEPRVVLKWPNDVLLGDKKVGGILVERSDGVVVVGMGLNLYWENPPGGAGALTPDDPGPEQFRETGALWAAEFMALVDADGWPLDEFRENCGTVGREITWEPNGRGRAVDVAPSGALLVETQIGIEELVAGAVHHIR
jgi:BirA family biotin operon repressor/biotin-[acetyl-CoA-carboxylase] ligase